MSFPQAPEPHSARGAKSPRNRWNVRPDTDSVVLCGSLRSSLSEFKDAYDDLTRDNVLVLSPNEPNVKGEQGGFVTFAKDHGSHADIERRHLEAMENADQILVLAPDGRLGASTAFELGYAYAVGLPVTFVHPAAEAILQGLAETGDGELPRPTPRALPALQRYYRSAAERRGWNSESADVILSLLNEEVDELHAAVESKQMGSGPDSIQSELADVLLYVIHMANQLGIDLHEAVVNKERMNSIRFESRELE